MYDDNENAHSFKEFTSIIHYSSVDFLKHDPSWIIYIADITGQFNLWKQRVSLGKKQEHNINPPIQLTTFVDETVRAAFPSPVDNSIILFVDHHGSENYQIYCLNVVKNTMWEIKRNPKVRYEWGSECYSNDGRFIVFSSNEQSYSSMHVYILDIKQNETFCITDIPGWYIPGYWSPDDKKISCLQILNGTNSIVWILDIEKRKMVKQLFSGRQSKNRLGQWSDNGDGFYILTNIKREYTGMAFFNSLSEKLEWISTPRFNIESVKLSKNGHLLVWSINENGYSRIHKKDLVTNEICRPRIENGVIGQIRISHNSASISFMLSTPISPYNLYILDLQTQKIERLTNALLSNIPTYLMIEPKHLHYSSFDGLQIPFFLYRPRSIKKKIGAVLSVHGGPASQERPRYAYEGLYQYLASQGIAVLAPNFRGSTGYSKSYEKMICHDWGGGELRDLEFAARWLKNQEWIDPNRIGVFGLSFGGFAVLSCVTRLPEYWKAAVDMFGPSNLITAIIKAPAHWRDADKQMIGDPENEQEFLNKRSPITYINNNIRADLLIIQGANDPRVVKQESDQIVELLRSFGRSVQYLVFEDEGHGFTKRHNLMKAYKIAGEFLVNKLS
jgi:protease II